VHLLDSTHEALDLHLAKRAALTGARGNSGHASS
jgi:dihydroxyacetone kinase-like predicted kinase